jgi:protein SDA1
MGLANGSQPLPFGHTTDAAVDIEGLTLLEDHFKALRGETDGDGDGDVAMDEDDEKGWENWDVESDSSEDDSESEGWVDVSDDEKDLVVSDSEDEKEKEDEDADKKAEEANRISTLATTKVINSFFLSFRNSLAYVFS